jgi:4-amino-4-deoxy-L-arabinose transferase-like glycosyltransferase
VLLALFALQLVLHASRTSVTTDESFHLLAGYRYWQCGDFGVNPEHPPLLKLVAALPLRLAGAPAPRGACGEKLTQKHDGFKAGNEFMERGGGYAFLVSARLAAASFSLLLALLVFFAAREMFGDAEALVALALLAFEPTLIAHGSLVTTDMAMTATMFGAVYALYRYVGRPSPARLLVGGLAVGLMLASKHSAVYALPILLLLVCASAVMARLGRGAEAGVFERELPRAVAALALMLVVGLVVLWATYGFRHSALPAAAGAHMSAVEYVRAGPHPEVEHTASGLLLKLFEWSRVFPASYTIGLADVISTGERTTYILGREYLTGQWFYFPVAFTVKTSLALLLLIPLSLLLRRLYRERPREVLFLLAPALVFMAVAMTWRINIGVRHVLPVYPFLLLLAAAGACALARRRRAALAALAVLLCYHGAVAAQTAPNYIAFGNALWGGTENTYRVLHDSNVEWEQNLFIVEDYLKRNGVKDCWAPTFRGAESVLRRSNCRLIFGAHGFMPEVDIEPVPEVIEGTVVLSASLLPPLGGEEYAQFARLEPEAILGGSMFVFRGRFKIPVAAALNEAARSTQLGQQKRVGEALAAARAAVSLAPDDPRTRAALGIALVRAGHRVEASRELDVALRQAQADPVSHFILIQTLRNVRMQHIP